MKRVILILVMSMPLISQADNLAKVKTHLDKGDRLFWVSRELDRESSRIVTAWSMARLRTSDGFWTKKKPEMPEIESRRFCFAIGKLDSQMDSALKTDGAELAEKQKKSLSKVIHQLKGINAYCGFFPTYGLSRLIREIGEDESTNGATFNALNEISPALSEMSKELMNLYLDQLEKVNQAFQQSQ